MTLEERIIATDQIHKLKARYFRSVDHRDWKGFADVFARDGTLEVINANGKVVFLMSGGEAISEAIAERIKGSRSVHHGHMPEIEIHSAEHASGIWAMEDRLSWPDSTFVGWGHYHERYIVEDGQWKIAHCQLRRLSLDFSPDNGDLRLNTSDKSE